MSHQILCPSCNTRLSVDVSLLGKKVHCGQCKTLINVSESVSQSRNTTTKVAPAVAPIARPVEQDFSALSSVPQATSPNPYRRTSSRKAPNNKPIVVTAVVGASLLILVVGGAVLVEFLQRTRADQAVVADAPMETAVANPLAKEIGSSRRSKANGASQLDPRKPALKPVPVQWVELESTSDSGLQRVQVPEGYSIAVPAGFMAANRSIHLTTAIYKLLWKNGTGLTLSVTDDRSITPDSPIPPVYASTTPDGKQTVRPIFTSQGLNFSETYKLKRMNVAFFELERNVSHDDMTEQLQFMFSGAMTPEMKRQYAPLMKEKIAFQSSLVMKAMDEHRMLDVVLVSEQPHPFAVPDKWMDYLKTLRREESENNSMIPRPFLHRYNPPTKAR